MEMGIGSLTVEGGVKIDCGEWGIALLGTDPRLDFIDGSVSAEWYALCGNGSGTINSDASISGGTLISREDVAIYHPQSGDLTITGGKIKGVWAGVQMCSGSLAISGSDTVITATSAADNPGKGDSMSDGSLDDGAAISIINRRGYKGGLGTIQIEDGTFEAVNSPVKYYGVSSTEGGNVTLDDTIGTTLDQFDITGGTFKGGSMQPAIRDYYAEAQTAGETIAENTALNTFAGITGGIFSSDMTDLINSDEYVCIRHNAGKFEVVNKTEASFDLNENGVKVREPLQLDVNENAETPKKTAVLRVSDDLFGPYSWTVEEGTDVIAVEMKDFAEENPEDCWGDEATVTALKAGEAVIRVHADALDKDVRLKVVAIDSSVKAEVGGSAPEVNSSVDSSAVETPAVDGSMTSEQETALETAKDALVGQVTSEVQNNSAVSGNAVEVNEQVVGSVMQDKVQDGTKLVIGTNQNLTDITMESRITYEKDAEGNIVLDAAGQKVVASVVPVIKTMTYEIEMSYKVMNPEGTTVLDSGIYNPDKQFAVTFRIPVPSSVDAKYANITHDGTPIGQYKIQGNGTEKYVELTVNHFSPFTLEFTNQKQSNSSSGGRSGGKSSGWHPEGSWVSDSLGWKFKTYEGPYAVNCWKQLTWNGQIEWYHFDANGYMQTGWFTDVDGRIYYLYPIPDGTRGRMMTGWQTIDGKMYYFNTVSDGTRGSMYVNRMTPDGILVGADGVRVQ